MVLKSHDGLPQEPASGEPLSSHDPAVTDPQLYKMIFENDRVRVLEYRDHPGDKTHPHRHPDSVMVTLSAFRRRISADGRQADVELPAGQARWLGAQEHTGENTGTTQTHSIFIELKEPNPAPVSPSDAPLGPETRRS
jgi:hypothetical protein